MTVVRRRLPWRDPLETAAALAERDGLLALLSDGGELGRWSWIGCQPQDVRIGGLDELDRLSGPEAAGTVALLSYDAGARAATGAREPIWPDFMTARYPGLLAFDHARSEVIAIGLGDQADAWAERAAGWLEAPAIGRPQDAPAQTWSEDSGPNAYLSAVADVVRRIGEGELFQANIARAWAGELKSGRQPFDVVRRLADRRSPYGAYWRIGDRALVSNSPELFLTVDLAGRRIETRPIKGTRARLGDPHADAAEIRALADSAKDRAENLMIVDLMRNDLARVCQPGSVRVERLFQVESHPTVHHLVSTIAGVTDPEASRADILRATFPPGSITGAPKHQAMKVIADYEGPRGPWCGSLVWIDPAARMTASVLIRTVFFQYADAAWRYRTLAGAGIVADSDPALELRETDAKILALKAALIAR